MPARGHPHEDLRPREARRAPPRRSSRPRPRAPSSRARSSPSRSSPLDCTGCGVCVTACPASQKNAAGEKTNRKAINMSPQIPLRETRVGELGVLPRAARGGPEAGQARHHQGLAADPAPLRVLGRLRGLRRDPVPEADEPALRRPRHDRQRHGLLVDLRRQPAHHALRACAPTAGAPRGATRCSRTPRSSATA